VGIHLAAEHALQLELAHVAFEVARLALDVAGRALIVLAFCELEQLGGVGYALCRAIDLLELGRQACAFLAEQLCAIRRGPDGGILELAADLFQAFLLQVVFKETPVASSCARRGL
jgi:hypothetical protein